MFEYVLNLLNNSQSDSPILNCYTRQLGTGEWLLAAQTVSLTKLRFIFRTKPINRQRGLRQ